MYPPKDSNSIIKDLNNSKTNEISDNEFKKQ
jgi:hypothetical protein